MAGNARAMRRPVPSEEYSRDRDADGQDAVRGRQEINRGRSAGRARNSSRGHGRAQSIGAASRVRDAGQGMNRAQSTHRGQGAGSTGRAQGRKNRRLLIVPIILILIIAAGAVFTVDRRIRYEKGVEKYTTAFLPGTSINGVDVSDQSVQEAAKELTFTLPDVDIQLQDGSSQQFSLADVGGSYDYTAELEKLKEEQDPKSWQKEKGKAYTDISPDLSYDESKVRDVVLAIPAVTDKNAVPPVDAYIAQTDSGFEIVPEEYGSKLDADKLVDLVASSLKEWNYSIDATGCYEQPKITVQDLKLTDAMSNITGLDMLYVNMSGGESATIDKATIMSWVNWDKDTNAVTIDSSKVHSYTQDLAQQYNTLGTIRTFVTHHGDRIRIGGSEKDTFGYKMDVDTTASRIENCILTGTREAWAYWPVAGFKRTENNDFGSTYVEVSIREQHLWYWVNGSVVLDTDVVTGAGENSTTPGVFMILDKQSPADLTGDNYVTHVSYWMPVTYTGTGLHDATWRSEFGKEIYVSGGSHGCINMPLDVVERLYSSIEMGTPVIIY